MCLPAKIFEGLIRLKNGTNQRQIKKSIGFRTKPKAQSSCSAKNAQTCNKSSLGNENRSSGGGATMTDNFGELSEDVSEVRDDEVSEDKRVFRGGCLTISCGAD